MKTHRFNHLMHLKGIAAFKTLGRGCFVFLLCLGLFNAEGAAPTGSLKLNSITNSALQSKDFAAFKIIYERNIFNPNRRANSGQMPREEQKPTRIDTITLTGTMQSDGEWYAFFDGSDSQYSRTALKPNQRLANLTLVEIHHDRVKFSCASNFFEVAMLMQLRREDNGDWKVRESPSFISNNSASQEFSSSSGDSAVDPDVLKRLLKKREQEDGGNASSSTSASDSGGPKPEVTQQTETNEPSRDSTSMSNASSSSSSSSSSPDDALRRLLQRREQE